MVTKRKIKYAKDKFKFLSINTKNLYPDNPPFVLPVHDTICEFKLRIINYEFKN